jgi:hypothetical protein
MLTGHTWFRPRLLLLATVTLLLAVSATWAQTVTGTLQGTVTDANGAVVPGSEIVIHNSDTGQERTLTTNSDGFYIASLLPLGRYNVTVSQKGFAKATKENIEINLNQTRVVDFILNPTGVTEAVLIPAEATAINTTNQQIAQSLTTQEIQDRPVANQTNFLDLATTFTGFQENPTSGQNNPTTSSGSSINFNGTGTRGATFQINGVNNDDSSENQNRQGASLATIKEFQVLTNSYTAEFGRGYGSVVLVQTLSGTNRVHGSAYWFHNDSALNATNNIFNPGLRKPVNRRNQFGFTAGFPVIKNHLFGFVSLDRTESSGSNVYTRDIFLPSERNPANWFKQTPVNDTPANRAFIESVLARFPANLVPNDPRTPRTFVGEQRFSFPDRDYSGRFDWNPRSSDTITGRWQYTRQIRSPFDVIIGEQVFQNNKQQNIGITWTHIFSPNTVGEFRYGLGLRTTLADVFAGNNTPVIRFTFTGGISGSIIGNAGGFPIHRYQTDNQFVYNFSMLAFRNHFLKAGTDIRRQALDDLADNFSRSFWSFSNNCNGVNYTTGFNAMLNGCISTFQRGYGPFFTENRINESNFYVEDNWRVHPNLTLDIGVRYEYVAAPREIRERINYGFGADKDNIEPRVGFAYSPDFQEGVLGKLFGGPGKSSIRGGFGIFHGRAFQSVFSQTGAGIRFNPPQALLFSKSATTSVNTDPQFNPFNLTDPTNGFVFVPGPQTARHFETLVDPQLQMPYTEQWNLTLERDLPFESRVRISYTGNRGIGLLRFASGNLPDNNPNGVLVVNHPNNAPSALYANLSSFPANDPRRVDVRGQVLHLAADPFCAGSGLPSLQPVLPGVTCPASVPLGALEYSFRVPRTNERRPDPLLTTPLVVSNSSWSYYHGLQIEWAKRLRKGLNFQMAYTWSKAIDTTSEATAVGTGDSNQLGPDLRNFARGLSRFDTRHRFTFYGTYQFPFFASRRDFVGQTLGGWQVSMVARLVSGTPFTVINSSGVDLDLDAFVENRPALIDPAVLGRTINRPATSQSQLPAQAFRAANPNDLDCCLVGRNTFFLDGVHRFDIGIAKYFQMPFEGHRLMLRADLFNAFNHVIYGFPNNDINSTSTPVASFGRLNTTANQYSPRSIQIVLRYTF